MKQRIFVKNVPYKAKTVFATLLFTVFGIHGAKDVPDKHQDSETQAKMFTFNVFSHIDFACIYSMEAPFINPIRNVKNDIFFLSNGANVDTLENTVTESETTETPIAPAKPVAKKSKEIVTTDDESGMKIVVGPKTVKYIYKDGTIEIREGGTLPWRNKNAGALRSSPDQICKANKFAVFASEEDGIKAMKNLLRSDKYCNLSLHAAVYKYAPPHENNTKKYQSDLKKYTGLDTNRKIRDLTDEELDLVAKVIKQLEGWRPGKLTIIEPQNQIIDTLARQNVR